MKLVHLMLGLWLAAGVSHAHAAEITYTCKRYQSKCTGEKCDQLAEAFQHTSDASQKLSGSTHEMLAYTIGDTTAHETHLNTQNDKEAITYQHVTITPESIVLENKTPAGAPKEKVTINPVNNFYSYYAMHTDGSVEGLALGLPFLAYFGWCELISPQPAQ